MKALAIVAVLVACSVLVGCASTRGGGYATLKILYVLIVR
ncbi:putative membrane protein [Glaesserella parasuis D74]|nr:putative membrane protein [Glaesserella parasuis D74]